MHDLIVFGEDYGSLPSSTQHLINGLADERKVIWINSIGLRQPKLSLKDARRAFNKCFTRRNTELEQAYSQTNNGENGTNITQVNLLTIPAPSSAMARKVARELMLRQLMPVLEKAELNQPILWSSLPTAADLCGYLNEHAVVYYCGDDFSALAGVDHVTVSKHEEKMADKANLILTASDTLTEKFPSHKTRLLTHGVDQKLFSTPAAIAPELAKLKQANQRPVAGFYGSISEWLDYPLLEEVTEALPEWDFVFIGPLATSNNPLPQRDNVHYLGPKAHNELPGFSQHWDVSMLPFRQNQQIAACSPLKLAEYVVAGRPIVTTPFPALGGYQTYVHCADNAGTFIQSLMTARNDSAIPAHALQHQSWDEKSRFLSWLMELL